MRSMMLKATWFRETRYVLSNWFQALLFFGIPVVTIVNMVWGPYTADEKMLYTVDNYVAWSGGFLLVLANSCFEDRSRGVIELVVQSDRSLWSYSLCKSLFYGSATILTQFAGTILVAVFNDWKFDWMMSLLMGETFAVQLLTVLCGGQFIMAATIMNQYMGIFAWSGYSVMLIGLLIVLMGSHRPAYDMMGLAVIALILTIIGSVVVQMASKRFFVPILSADD